MKKSKDSKQILKLKELMNNPPKINFPARHRAREFAVQALYQWQLTHQAVSGVAQQYCEHKTMVKADQAYFKELLVEIVNHHAELDEKLTPVLDRKFTELDPIEMAILRIGTYELMYRIEIPYRVVINEAVELAKSFGAVDGHKYVNGVLDKLAKQIRINE